MEPLTAFLARCTAYEREHGVSRVWLSKELFQDTYKLQQLARGEVDVGVKRLQRAADELHKLEVQAAAMRLARAS